ncbi:MAG: hypothetical protein R2867_05530 [Caldilineaceae bacterium]
MGPEAGSMADKDRLGTGTHGAGKGLDPTPVPPVGPWIGVGRCRWHNQCAQPPAALFTTKAIEAQRVEIIIHHTQLQLAIDLYAMQVNRCLQLIDGIRPSRVRCITEDEFIRCRLFVAQTVAKGQRVAILDQRDFEIGIGNIFVRRRFPREQPGALNSILRHVGQKFLQIVAVPLGMIVQRQ